MGHSFIEFLVFNECYLAPVLLPKDEQTAKACKCVAIMDSNKNNIEATSGTYGVLITSLWSHSYKLELYELSSNRHKNTKIPF